MIGSGEHHGYVGTRLTTGDIIHIGGVHTTAWIRSCIGITAIGTTTTILSALTGRCTTIIHTIVRCMIEYVVMTMRTVIPTVRLLRAMLRAISKMHVPLINIVVLPCVRHLLPPAPHLLKHVCVLLLLREAMCRQRAAPHTAVLMCVNHQRLLVRPQHAALQHAARRSLLPPAAMLHAQRL